MQALMKYLLAILLLLFASPCIFAQQADIDELLSDLAEAQSPKEKMILQYELSEAYLRVNARESESYGKLAYNAAIEQDNKSMAARSAYQIALAFERQRDERNTEVWLRTALNYAKQIVGNRQVGGARQFLPIKVNSAGVMPIIFAQAIMFLTSMGEQDFSPELYLIPSALAGE
jgi:hypothetical protein